MRVSDCKDHNNYYIIYIYTFIYIYYSIFETYKDFV